MTSVRFAVRMNKSTAAGGRPVARRSTRINKARSSTAVIQLIAIVHHIESAARGVCTAINTTDSNAPHVMTINTSRTNGKAKNRLIALCTRSAQRRFQVEGRTMCSL